MDTVQCAVILAKLERFNWEVGQRIKIGERYNQLMDEAGTQRVQQRDDRTSIFAQYTLIADNRDQLQRVLQGAGIPIAIHYPFALNEQTAYKKYNEQIMEVSEQTATQVLSLPMGPELTESEQEKTVAALVNS